MIRGLLELLGLDEGEISNRLRFVSLSERDVELLKDIYNRIEEEDLESIFQAFYDHLLSFEETREILESEPGLIERLKGFQAGYLRELLRAEYGAEYAISRLRTGYVHESRGVEPKLFTGAFAKWVEIVAPLVGGETPEEYRDKLIALFKAVVFDITLSLEAYFFSRVLRGRDVKYRTLFNSVPDAVIVADLGSLRIVEANESALGLLGRGEEDITALSLLEIHPPEIRDQVERLYRNMEGGERIEGTVSILNQTTGEVIPVELNVSRVELEGRHCIMCIYRDLRSKLRKEEELRKLTALYRLLSRINRVVTTVRDVGRLFEESVKAIKEEGGFKCVGIFKVGDGEPVSICGECDQDDVQAVILIKPDGEKRFYMLVAKNRGELFTEEEVRLLAEIVGDLSFALSSLTFREEALHTKNHDPTTNLPNRTFFVRVLRDTLELARVRREEVGLVVVDVDHFGEINQAMGHEYGEELLKAVADGLRDVIRKSDFLARIGADEFAIIALSGNVRVAVDKLISRIQERFSQPVVLDSKEVFVTFSYGVAFYPGDGTSHEDLFANALASLDRAKSQGGERVVYYSRDVVKITEERVKVRTDLRKALERKEFRLYYQPKVDLKTGKIADCEALIRWIHEGKVVPPVRFIPVLEESGLIHDVGEWVVSEACRQIKEWQGKGIDMAVAVNISPNQLKLPLFADKLLYIISSQGGMFDRLEVEITESAMMEDVRTSVDFLNALASYGIKTYIDDFGTGYSSLAYLKKLPVYALKIDREFIKDLPGDRDDLEIVKATISLAKTFGLKTVAEGVETKEQVDLLRDLGCDYAQGFYFGKPMPADEFENFVSSWRGY